MGRVVRRDRGDCLKLTVTCLVCLCNQWISMSDSPSDALAALQDRNSPSEVLACLKRALSTPMLSTNTANYMVGVVDYIVWLAEGAFEQV